jgi:hypothetical protein
MKNKSQLTDGHVQCNGGAFHYYLSKCIVSLKTIYVFICFICLIIFIFCLFLMHVFINNNCMPSSYMNLCCWFDFNLKRSSHSLVQSVVLCSCHSFMISHEDFKYCKGSTGCSVSDTAEVRFLWDVMPCCGRVVLQVSEDHSPRMLDP